MLLESNIEPQRNGFMMELRKLLPAVFLIFGILPTSSQIIAKEQTKEVIFIRHAQSEFNRSKKRQLLTTIDSLFKFGASKKDAELTLAGLIQVLTLRKNPNVSDLVNNPQIIYLTSRLHRALNTTLLLAHGLDPSTNKKIFITGKRYTNRLV